MASCASCSSPTGQGSPLPRPATFLATSPSVPAGASSRSVSWDQVDKRKFHMMGPFVLGLIRTAIYPADVIKTRMQMQRTSASAATRVSSSSAAAAAAAARAPPVYSSALDAVSKISAREGIGAFFRGYAPSVLGVFGTQLYVGVLESTRAGLSARYANKDPARRLISDPALARSVIDGQAGVLGALCTHLVTTPLEVISQKMRMQGLVGHGGAVVGGAVQSARQMAAAVWRTDGLRGLYRGFGAQLLASAPTHGIFWASYHRMVERLPAWGEAARAAMGVALPPVLAASAPSGSVAQDTLVQGTAAFCSGAAAVFVMNPLDVVKTRLQVEGTRGQTTASTFRALVAHEGVGALWKGSSARVMAAAPTAVMMIVYFESMKRLSAQALLDDVGDAVPSVMLTVHAQEKGREEQ